MERKSGLAISPYRIEVPLSENETVVYSTLTTSLVVMEDDVFEEVFCKGDFSNAELCSELLEMGFLYSEEEPQSELLRQSREHVLNAETGITGVTIAPTMACNARCYYCFEHGARRGCMDEGTADAVADFLIERCTEKKIYIAWFGGEPLLAPGVIDRITAKIKAAGIAVESTITTNGLLLDRSVRERLTDWGTYRVQITLDGVGEEYNRIKSYVGFEGDPFETVMGNIEALFRQGGISVHIRLNYRSTDRRRIEETFQYVNERFGDEELLYLYGAPLDLPESKSYSEFDRDEGCLFLDVLRLSLDNGFENDELNFRAGVNVSGDYNAVLGELMLSPFPAPCFMTNKWRFVIDDRGKLYKCQKHLGREEYSCGDVFSGVQENECFSYYATSGLHDPQCEACFMLPICQGGCNANRLLYGDKFACPPSKSIAQDLVMAYYRYLTGDDELMGKTMSKYRKEDGDEGCQQGFSKEGPEGA